MLSTIDRICLTVEDILYGNVRISGQTLKGELRMADFKGEKRVAVELPDNSFRYNELSQYQNVRYTLASEALSPTAKRILGSSFER